ncbi:MAG: UDP-N-acetylenolpyruvoylglucosamine reductase [Syntrophus sp. (in: bacteria)]|nr:UDP-N-acetylenolpyruvoylglucosamine reductase [Syntrophus sp. (in: bacteria)]
MDQASRKILRAITAGPVLFDEPLDRYTSLKVGGRADALVFPQSVEEIGKLVLFFRQSDRPFLVVGNWTNLLVRDGGYRGAIIAMKDICRITWVREDQDRVMVDVQAGVSLSDLVHLTAERALAGMAFCAGIPGSVGGAVMMNAGAYGSEIKDVIYKVVLMDDQSVVTDRLRRDLSFEYRRLNVPQGTIVLGAVFCLERGDPREIRQGIDEIVGRRRQKHPLDYPSAGSIFKNPAGHSAGLLIEAAGLKGTQIGGAKISEKHGNFIINTGGAKAVDILALIERVQEKVFKQTGIVLETEVRIVGE